MGMSSSLSKGEKRGRRIYSNLVGWSTKGVPSRNGRAESKSKFKIKEHENEQRGVYVTSTTRQPDRTPVNIGYFALLTRQPLQSLGEVSVAFKNIGLF